MENEQQINVPQRKLIKVMYEYDDGATEYIEGQSLENFKYNMNLGGSCIRGHNFMGMFRPVTWKVMDKQPVKEEIEKAPNDVVIPKDTSNVVTKTVTKI